MVTKKKKMLITSFIFQRRKSKNDLIIYINLGHFLASGASRCRKLKKKKKKEDIKIKRLTASLEEIYNINQGRGVAG